jgi:hypothetical protein
MCDREDNIAIRMLGFSVIDFIAEAMNTVMLSTTFTATLTLLLAACVS